jgi:DNA-binding phage protein
MTIADKTMPKSLPYHDFLISNLKDPNYAAVYLETHMEMEEDEAIDPKLIQLALSNVAEALGSNNMTPDQVKHHQGKLNVILSQPANIAIYNLASWLNDLGLKLTVKLTENSEGSIQNSDISELSHS